jgi:hypothetical protein
MAAAIIGYLTLSISFTGVDLHGWSRLSVRFGWAAVFFCFQVAFLSMVNTVLFILLGSGVADKISKRIPRILYYPEISLLFGIILLGAANWCCSLSIFFFFMLFDRGLLFILLGVLCLVHVFAYGPLIALTFGLYFTIRPDYLSYFSRH